MATLLLANGNFRAELDTDKHTLSLRSPLWPELALEGVAPALVVGQQVQAPAAVRLVGTAKGQATVEWHFSAPALLLVQMFTQGTEPDELHLETELLNRGDAGLLLNRVTLLGTCAGGVTLSRDPQSLRLLYESGYSAYVQSVADLLAEAKSRATADEAGFLAQSSAETESKQASLLSQMASVCYSPTEKRAFLCGFDSFRRWLGSVEYALSSENGISSWQAGFDGGDLLVLPGERLPLESLMFLLGREPWATWERYVELVAERNGLRSRQQPPVSWCSWYPYRLGVDEDKVLVNADVGATRLRPLGLSVIEVDLGWEEGYLPSSYRENRQFPHGLAWLATELAKRGLKLGAWKAPYTVSEFDPVAREHPDWLLQGLDGKPQPLGTWFWIPHGQTYALDLTHPEARDYLRRNIRSLAERGARYLKTDFIGAASAPNARGRRDQRLVAGGGIEAARLGSAIIAEEMYKADPEALLLNCNPYEPAGLGYYNLLYTCMDTGNTGFVGWQHLRDVYTTTAVHMAKNRRWGIIQPSCLCVGLPGTLEEARVRATATFLSGGQVDISDDLTSLPEDRWQVLLATLPPLGLSARPIDLFEPVPVRSLSYEGLCRGEAEALSAGQSKVGPRIWHLPMSREGEAWHLLGLFEFDPPASQAPLITWFQVPLERLGLDPSGQYWAYEFWSGQFLGIVPRLPLPQEAYRHPGDAATLVLAGKEGCLEVAFFGPAVKLIALRPVHPHPWPVGTSFHQSCGMELAALHWSAQESILHGQLRRPAGQHGSITIAGALPGEVELSLDGRPGKVRRAANGAIVFDVVTQNPVTDWQLRWFGGAA